MVNSKEESFTEFITMLGRRIFDRIIRGDFDYKKDMRQLEHYRTQAQRVNLPLLEARMLNGMAILASAAGHMNESESLYNQLLQIYEAENNAEGRVRTLNNLAEDYFFMGRTVEAMNLYNRGIEIAQKDADLVVDYAHVLTGKLVMLVSDGYFEEAEMVIEQMQRVAQELIQANRHEYARLYVKVYGCMAEIELDRGNYRMAWQHARQALELANGLNLTFEKAETLFIQAHIATDDPNSPTPAYEHWQEAQAILDNMKAPAQVGRTLLTEGRYLFRHQQADKAHHFVQKALTIFTQHGITDGVQQAQALLTTS